MWSTGPSKSPTEYERGVRSGEKRSILTLQANKYVRQVNRGKGVNQELGQ
jgi:hypothetical protein